MTRSRTAATRPPTPTTPARGRGGGAGRQGSNKGGRSRSSSRSNSRRNPPSPTPTATAAAAAAALTTVPAATPATAPTTVQPAAPAAVTATAPTTHPGTPEAVPTTQILPLPITPPMHQQTTVPQATALLTPRAGNITNLLPNSGVPHSHHEDDPSNTPTNHQNILSRPPTPQTGMAYPGRPGQDSIPYQTSNRLEKMNKDTMRKMRLKTPIHTQVIGDS